MAPETPNPSWVDLTFLGGLGEIGLNLMTLEAAGYEVGTTPWLTRDSRTWFAAGAGYALSVADEIAALTGTISYEVFCRVGARVPRVYRAAEFPRVSAEPA